MTHLLAGIYLITFNWMQSILKSDCQSENWIHFRRGICVATLLKRIVMKFRRIKALLPLLENIYLLYNCDHYKFVVLFAP